MTQQNVHMLIAQNEALRLLLSARMAACHTLERHNKDLQARLNASLEERRILNEKLRAPLIKQAFASMYQGRDEPTA